jgi:hypothetical protein
MMGIPTDDSNLSLARRYDVSDGLISKIRRREVWVDQRMRRRNDVPRTVVLATLVLEGLRISELCALDGEDLDFAGRRIYVPRLRRTGDGKLVRVQGIKTEAAERVIPMLPAAYDLLLDHKASFDFGAKDPVFATRNGRRNTVDNLRRRIVDGAVSAPTICWSSAGSGDRHLHPAHPATNLRPDPGRAEPAAETSHVPHRAHQPELDHARLPAGPRHGRCRREDPREGHRLLADRRLHTAFGARGFVPQLSPERKKCLPARCVERAGRRGNRLVAGNARKRLMGLEPTTFCMAKRT